MDIYSNAYAAVNGTPIVQATTITVDKNPSYNQVATLALGLAGVTIGAGLTEVTIDNAVPSTDFELCPDEIMKVGEVVDLAVFMAGRQSTQKAFINGATYKAGVNESSSLSMKFLCRLESFK